MRLFLWLAAIAAALSFVATAVAATLTSSYPPYPPTTAFVNYYQVLNPYTCHGGHISASGLPVLIKFGWASNSLQEEKAYFQSEFGTVTLTGPDTYSDSFGKSPSGSPPPSSSGQGGGWSPIFQTTIANNGTAVNGYLSSYLAVLSAPLTPGSYTLNWSFTLTKSVNDGFGAIQKGTYTSSCTFTVS